MLADHLGDDFCRKLIVIKNCNLIHACLPAIRSSRWAMLRVAILGCFDVNKRSKTSVHDVLLNTGAVHGADLRVGPDMPPLLRLPCPAWRYIFSVTLARCTPFSATQVKLPLWRRAMRATMDLPQPCMSLML